MTGFDFRIPLKKNTATAFLRFILTPYFQQKPHSEFIRDGNDLKCTHEISLKLAILGGLFEYAHIDGRRHTVNLLPFESVSQNKIYLCFIDTEKPIPSTKMFFCYEILGVL